MALESDDLDRVSGVDAVQHRTDLAYINSGSANVRDLSLKVRGLIGVLNAFPRGDFVEVILEPEDDFYDVRANILKHTGYELHKVLVA